MTRCLKENLGWFGMVRSGFVWFKMGWCMGIVYMYFHEQFWPIHGKLVWFGMVRSGLVFVENRPLQGHCLDVMEIWFLLVW